MNQRRRFLALLPGLLPLQALLSTGIRAQPENSPGSRPPGDLVQATDRFLEKDGVTLRYREIGSGPPVILLHGFMLSLEIWDTVATALAAEHRVIALDFRGFGASSKFSTADDFGTRMGLDVIALMDYLDIDRAHVVGHSLGALYAAWLAAQHQDRLLSATMVAGPFYEYSQAPEQEMLASLQQGGGIERFVQYASPVPMADADAAAISQFFLSSNDRASMIGVLEALADIRRITTDAHPAVPALIICGTADPLLPAARDLRDWWPVASYLELPEVDHMSVIERPETIAAIRERLH